MVLILWLVSACGPTTTGRVAPALAAIETLGLDCGGGERDNEPSGLSQWSCAGTIDGENTRILVDGNDAGVSEIDLFLGESKDAATTRELFERVVDTVPPLSNAPEVKTTLADWDGRQRLRVLGGVRVTAACDETLCWVVVMGADEPLRPLPLP